MGCVSNVDRKYDKTHLSIDTAEERILVHRDYIAHCLRWSHVVKRLYERHTYQSARILDIGCGKEVPLAKLLYSNRMTGACYCGVDMNDLELPEMLTTAVENKKLEVTLKPKTDASILTADDLPWIPTIITCFEVFEHVHPAIARRLVINLRKLIHENGRMYFSTPNWNGSAAANHVNETRHSAIAAVLMECGWKIEEFYGTFASQKDYADRMNVAERDIFNRLAEYYDSNLLSVMLAPLFPSHSRNTLWVLSPMKPSEKKLQYVPTPWSQHKDWQQLEGEIG